MTVPKSTCEHVWGSLIVRVSVPGKTHTKCATTVEQHCAICQGKRRIVYAERLTASDTAVTAASRAASKAVTKFLGMNGSYGWEWKGRGKR